ncbi:MAG: LPS-assembly protein LptD [Gammaproteobacteria bacterium]
MPVRFRKSPLKLRPILLFSALACCFTNAFAAEVNLLQQNCIQITPNSEKFCLPKSDKPDVDFTKLSSEHIGTILGWVCDNSLTNVCGGFYKDPDSIKAYPNPAPALNSPTTITAKQQAVFSQEGASVLVGDVTITQPGREVIANKVAFWRNNKTGQITRVELLGNVQLHESGRLIVAKNGSMDLGKETTTLQNAIYRIAPPAALGANSVWGRAKEIFRNSLGVLKLSKATFSSCSPNNVSWHIISNKINLDKNSGRGQATNAFLFARNIPVFYLPYIDFPLDSRRKTGLLYPTVSNSTLNGFSISWPYYFNLAPNYDLTLTPQYITKRGFFTDAMFRYLTEKNEGKLNLGYISGDKAFSSFKRSAPFQYPPTDLSTARSLENLANYSTDRGFIAFGNKSNLNKNWQSSLDLNMVSDDYFQQDFHTLPGSQSTDQLFNQASLNYNNEHWHFLGTVQAFQTLHPLTAVGAVDQYTRLPQLNLNASYPNEPLGLTYGLDAKAVRFDHKKSFATNIPIITADRISITPSVSLPKHWASAYLTPRVDAVLNNYQFHDRENTPQVTSNSLGEVLPIASIDSGMFFSRNMKFFKANYEQTLEPRAYYLYVPERDQSTIPLFDTNLPVFGFDTMFRNNRFVGMDRIGDANQVAVAVTSRFLDDYNGQEKMNLNIGQIYALHKHTVFLDTKNTLDPLTERAISPLVGKLQYNINEAWDTSADAAWDTSNRLLTSSTVSVHYHDNARRIVNFVYNFARKGDQFLGQTKDLNRIDVSLSIPITQTWNLIGDWNYNVSFIHPQTYFYGIEYESCCFAMRFVQGRTFIGPDNNNSLKFDSQMYFQFVLKGLGAVGSQGLNSFLTSKITNYQDRFSTRSVL